MAEVDVISLLRDKRAELTGMVVRDVDCLERIRERKPAIQHGIMPVIHPMKQLFNQGSAHDEDGGDQRMADDGDART